MKFDMSNWKRISIESSVIVASILLAFAIDAAWNKTQEFRIETEILKTIESDMHLTLAQLDSIYSQNLRAMDSGRAFLTSNSEFSNIAGETRVPPDVRPIFFRALYQPTDGSLSNTNISQISDLPLRNAVALWIRESARTREQAILLEEQLVLLRQLSSSTSVVLSENIRRGLIPTDSSEGNPEPIDIYRKLRQDPDFVGSLLIQNIIRDDYNRVVDILRMQTEEVLGLIQNER